MNSEESFSNATCEDALHLAESELTAFIGAVTQLFGPAQARLSAEEWLDESDLVDSLPRSTSRDWRAVSVAASARLARRLTRDNVGPHTDLLTSFPYVGSPHKMRSAERVAA